MRPTMQAIAWYDELQRIADKAPKLPPPARKAVRRVVVSFLDEGEQRPAGLEHVLARIYAE
jgi:hypothetical protein